MLQLEREPSEVEPQNDWCQHNYEGHEELCSPNEELDIDSVHSNFGNVERRPWKWLLHAPSKVVRAFLASKQARNPGEVKESCTNELGEWLQHGEREPSS